ncbi:hypothetical protein M422DRAFT_272583 [Sphaerobolus stellatus SS14]|uniref:Uncharacterized protein n=1 Tax=Sphaerobolus stellatus (strain SS14) TaxID=990650 RepID=A0A0C9UM39_SPHS4|nr:hypothetical protein M422DRAFT_272583 [Sphaerobolus stellatus SS14]
MDMEDRVGPRRPNIGRVEDAVEGLTHEAIHLKWLHAKASLERWEEETKLLKAEGECVGKSFEWLKGDWRRREVEWSRDGTVSKGAIAYATRTVGTFEVLKKKAWTHFSELLSLINHS